MMAFDKSALVSLLEVLTFRRSSCKASLEVLFLLTLQLLSVGSSVGALWCDPDLHPCRVWTLVSMPFSEGLLHLSIYHHNWWDEGQGHNTGFSLHRVPRPPVPLCMASLSRRTALQCGRWVWKAQAQCASTHQATDCMLLVSVSQRKSHEWEWAFPPTMRYWASTKRWSILKYYTVNIIHTHSLFLFIYSFDCITYQNIKTNKTLFSCCEISIFYFITKYE